MGDIKVTTTTLPSYLKAFLKQEYPITLITGKVAKCEGKENQCLNKDIMEVSNMSALELTGSPLEVDLGGNEDSIVNPIKFERPPTWSSVEAEHYPVSLIEARKYLNQELDLIDGKLEIKPKPTYCVCDGEDPESTIILGACMDPIANTFSRTFVSIWPCHEDSENVLLEMTKKEHTKYARGSDTKTSIQKCFYLYGYDLRNHPQVQNAETNGSISVEICSQTHPDGRESKSDSTMNLQVVLGHKRSNIEMYWQDVCRVRLLIEILGKNQFLVTTPLLGEDTLDFKDIAASISEISNQCDYIQKDIPQMLDLNNLRKHNLLDKLWLVLHMGKNLGDLREALHGFFEELAEARVRFSLIPPEDLTNIAHIVNGIIEGKFAVPNLSLKECLEVLIELGLEKLKNDYKRIIDSVCPMFETFIWKRWKALWTTDKAPQNTAMQRRTMRISVTMKSSLDSTSWKKKLSCVESMHTVCEFMFFYRENFNLDQEVFNILYEKLGQKYFNDCTKVPIPTHGSNFKLVEFSFSSVLDDGLIESNIPTWWTVNHHSSIDPSAEVTTIFHFSMFPVFPPSIWKENDISECQLDLSKWSAAKLVTFINHTC